MGSSIDALMKLRSVTFCYKSDEHGVKLISDTLSRNWRGRHPLSSCLAEDFTGLGTDQAEAKLLGALAHITQDGCG
jgi:hypothetical protein